MVLYWAFVLKCLPLGKLELVLGLEDRVIMVRLNVSVRVSSYWLAFRATVLWLGSVLGLRLGLELEDVRDNRFLEGVDVEQVGQIFYL